jgi:hypothetical protein
MSILLFRMSPNYTHYTFTGVSSSRGGWKVAENLLSVLSCGRTARRSSRNSWSGSRRTLNGKHSLSESLSRRNIS